MDPIIEVTNLRKTYGDLTAVDDVSLAVRPGEIFGIVGPNGAGKTTTVEMAQGLRRPDAGTVRVLGVDPFEQSTHVRQRVGTQLQQAVLPDRMRVREALALYSSYYDDPLDPDRLLEEWQLVEKRDAAFDSLSGGQRQRLFIALALVGSPEVVFLDELTTGLDPAARRATWDHVRAIRDRGVTVVLVTHFMDEAEKLCDRVAIIDGGRVVAQDTPDRLTASIARRTTVRFGRPPSFDPGWLHHASSVRSVDVDGSVVTVTGVGALLAEVANALAARGVFPDDLAVERTSLEDAFLAITSRQSRGAGVSADA